MYTPKRWQSMAVNDSVEWQCHPGLARFNAIQLHQKVHRHALWVKPFVHEALPLSAFVRGTH
jgi:hypothetical protein